MALQFKSIHLQFIGVSLDPRSAPIQHALDFSRSSLREEYILEMFHRFEISMQATSHQK